MDKNVLMQHLNQNDNVLVLKDPHRKNAEAVTHSVLALGMCAGEVIVILDGRGTGVCFPLTLLSDTFGKLAVHFGYPHDGWTIHQDIAQFNARCVVSSGRIYEVDAVGGPEPTPTPDNETVFLSRIVQSNARMIEKNQEMIANNEKILASNEAILASQKSMLEEQKSLIASMAEIVEKDKLFLKEFNELLQGI